MKITQQRLYEIILEEYAKEEELEEALGPEKLEQFLAWIRGKGPKPDWATDDLGKTGIGQAVQAPGTDSVDRAADTMPFGIESEPEPEAEVGPESLEDRIFDMIKGMSPEEVQELFQAVFVKIPGVEMGDPDEEPESLYKPGAEGRPTISLGPLREAVFARLMEAGGTMYRGMGAAYKRDEEEEDDTDEDTEETEEDV